MKALATTLAVFLATATATAAGAGMYYEAVTRGEGAKGAEMADSTVKAWVDGDNAKVLFDESGNPMMEQGSYLVTRDGGKTVYLVNPKEKTYAVWDLDAIMGMAGGAMQMARGMMNMKFSEPEVEKLAEEPGGSMLGMSTTHYRYRTTYTMSMSFMGMKNQTKSEQLQDVWSTTELSEAGFGIWLRREPPKTGDEGLDRLIATEMDKIHGVPLKSVTVMTSTDTKKGETRTTTTTTEVTKLDKVSVPSSTFEIPAGYTETQLIPTGEEGEEGDEPVNPLSKLFGKKKG